MTNRNKVTANNGTKERQKGWTQFVIVIKQSNQRHTLMIKMCKIGSIFFDKFRMFRAS